MPRAQSGAVAFDGRFLACLSLTDQVFPNAVSVHSFPEVTSYVRRVYAAADPAEQRERDDTDLLVLRRQRFGLK